MLTKPAGVFLQLVAVLPIVFWLFVEINHGSHWSGAIGLLLLWAGGMPARRKAKD